MANGDQKSLSINNNINTTQTGTRRARAHLRAFRPTSANYSHTHIAGIQFHVNDDTLHGRPQEFLQEG